MGDVLAAVLRPENRAIWEPFFHPKIRRGGPDDCWEWQASRRAGYGRFKATGFSVSAHRLAYALAQGNPGDLLVCHRCDNPPCCNPAHLFLGTNKVNSDDKIAKGRARVPDQRGENNGAAKLTAVQVEEIKRRIRAGQTNVRIAKDYGVTHALVSRIRRGRSWGTEPIPAPYAPLRGRSPEPPHCGTRRAV